MLWFALWLSHRLYTWFQPRAHRWILLTFDFCNAHPRFAQLTVPLIDPNQRDYAGLLLWAVLLAAAAIAANAAVPADTWPVSLVAWRNPIADDLLGIVERLGRTVSVLVFSGVASAWLLLRKRPLAAAHLLLGTGFAWLLGAVVHGLFFPPLIDGAVLTGAVVYGFAAVLIAEQTASAWRWASYAGATLVAVVIAFSRLYFGVVGLFGALVSLGLALIWLILVGVAYRRHAPEQAPLRGMGAVFIATAAVLAMTLGPGRPPESAAHRKPRAEIAESAWLHQGWTLLPAYRMESLGRPEQPLALQWAGPLDAIRSQLREQGWRDTQSFTARSALVFLNPSADIADLPVLPHYHQTDVDAVRMLKPLSDGRWLIVRLWPSELKLAEGANPVWLGHVGFLEARSVLGLVKFSAAMGDDLAALRVWVSSLGGQIPAIERPSADGRTAILIPPQHQ